MKTYTLSMLAVPTLADTALTGRATTRIKADCQAPNKREAVNAFRVYLSGLGWNFTFNEVNDCVDRQTN